MIERCPKCHADVNHGSEEFGCVEFTRAACNACNWVEPVEPVEADPDAIREATS